MSPSSWTDSYGEERVAREIFPLPTLLCGHLDRAKLSQWNRSITRRLLRGQRRQDDFVKCISGLSACYSGSGLHVDCGSSFSKHFSPSHSQSSAFAVSAAQAQVLDHVRSAISSLGPPPADLSPSGALAELRGTVSGYECSPKEYPHG